MPAFAARLPTWLARARLHRQRERVYRELVGAIGEGLALQEARETGRASARDLAREVELHERVIPGIADRLERLEAEWSAAGER